MANLHNSATLQQLLVANPYTGRKVDILPLFSLLHQYHEPLDGPENFTTLARILIEAVNELNVEAAQSKAQVGNVAESNCTLNLFSLTFLEMRNEV